MQQFAYKKAPSKTSPLTWQSILVSPTYGEVNWMCCIACVLLRPQFLYKKTRKGKTKPSKRKNQSQKLNLFEVTTELWHSLKNPPNPWYLFGTLKNAGAPKGNANIREETKTPHFRKRESALNPQTLSWNGHAKTWVNAWGELLTCLPVLSMCTRTASRSLRAPVPTTSAV